MQPTHTPANRPDAQPETRRLDGEPETDADRRFFDLRESGYTGPIDQDGDPVRGEAFATQATPSVDPLLSAWPCPACDHHHSLASPLCHDMAQPSQPVSRTLHGAALYLSRHGWTQGSYYDDAGGSFQPPCCLVGALGMVCYGGPVDAPALNDSDPGWPDFDAAITYLDGYLQARYGVDVYTYNDAPGRTVEDIRAMLTEAAALYELNTLTGADTPGADPTQGGAE